MKAIEKKAPPIAYLLECSDGEVGNYELAMLPEVANLRNEMAAMFDRIVDVSSLAVLAVAASCVKRATRHRIESRLQVIFVSSCSPYRSSNPTSGNDITEKVRSVGLSAGSFPTRKEHPCD